MLPADTFLEMIRERPEDDGPRLVFADWLEEHGDCARAELIRLQCQVGGEARIAELIHAHGSLWAGPVARHAYSYAFHRGFVEEITISADALLAHGDELFAAAPIRLLRLIGARSLLHRLVRSPLLARISALHLTGGNLGDAGADLLGACQHLARLRTLRLGHNSIKDGGLEYLVDSPYLTGLHTLSLPGNLIGDLGTQILAISNRFDELQALDLSDNQIGEAGADTLAHAAGLPRLQRLDLSNQFKGWSSGAGPSHSIQLRQREALAARFGTSVCTF